MKVKQYQITFLQIYHHNEKDQVEGEHFTIYFPFYRQVCSMRTMYDLF
jgi:hypothetical protein